MSLQFWFNTGVTKSARVVQMKSWQEQYQALIPCFTLARHFTSVPLPAFGIQAPQPLEGTQKSPCAQERKLRCSKRKASAST